MPLPSIWKQPFYRFTLPEGNGLLPYFFDVTKSAVMTETKGFLAEKLDWAVGLTNKRSPKILDFGAGRLRNTNYLLAKGHSVTAVEFGKLANSESVRPALDRAKGYGSRFSELVFPHEFFTSGERFDLIILVNVLNIMPVPTERCLALQYCRDKLTKDGIILWYSQTGKDVYLGKVPFSDGKMSSEGNRFRTFYKDYSEDEIDELFAANGLRLKKKWEGDAQNHYRSRVYKKVGFNPTQEVLSATLVRRYVRGDIEYAEPKDVVQKVTRVGVNGRPNLPNPEELSPNKLYAQSLPKIPAGELQNNTYQSLIAAIFLHLFYPNLSGMTFEHAIHERRGEIDIVFKNHPRGGFFSNFQYPDYPRVYVECKNLSHDIGPREFEQTVTRVATTKSHFGILTCRRNKNRSRVLGHCRDANSNRENVVLWFDDADILNMLNATDANELDELLWARAEEVRPSD